MSGRRSKEADSEFDRSVFVNCPFDDEYRALFRPLIFTIHSLGFKPRFALERADCGEVRLAKIIDLIAASRWGIHDLSRCKAKRRGEFYRMNMPLELGLDIGAKTFGAGDATKKRFLILEEERYRFQQAVSDLAGCDIKAHENQPVRVVTIVKNWLVQEASAPSLSPTLIWSKFLDFTAATHVELRNQHYSVRDIEELPEIDLSRRMEAWLEK